jgi:hypothetical protein
MYIIIYPFQIHIVYILNIISTTLTRICFHCILEPREGIVGTRVLGT